MTRPTLKSSLLATCAFPLLLAAPAALAQEVTDLDTIIMSGSLSPTPASRTGASVEVIEGEALSEDATTLTDALSRVPGVSFSANGGTGAASNVRIRGLSNIYTGVRIDGIDVTNPSNTQTSFNFGGLTGAGISRVEVLKGSQSALYGSEAIGGVIDITTARPEKMGFSGSGSVEYGSFDTKSASLTLSQKEERAEITLSYSVLESDGISARAGDTETDGVSQNTLTFSSRFNLTDNVVVGMTGVRMEYDLEIDRSTVDNSGSNQSLQRGGRVFTEITTGAIQHTISYSVFNSEFRDPGGFSTYFDSERKQLSYLANADLNANLRLNFGLDRTEESADTASLSNSVETTSAFGELQWAVRPDVDLSLAARYDDHSVFGGQWSGRAAGVWRVSEATSLRAVFGTGFRAPSLYELYSAYGDSALQPEKSRSAELGIEHRFGARASIEATLFYTEIDDLIGFDPSSVACGSGFGCYNQVSGLTVSKGLELGGKYALSDAVSLYGNYTLTDAKNSGVRLVRVPRHDLVVGIDADLTPRLGARLEVQHVADVDPSAFAPANHKVGDYTLVNLTLDYAMTDQAKAYLRVENLTDEDYETAGGYNMPGRAITFGLRADF
ncbi:TonB-dependent receptor plug domain-containing protein [Rhodalgimonas zhirmunskyi]|uniref:TonB-dependent receptor n=1 Tax=Rhodalgimonas zhirmunskyi TaxID=2964767 RepID=A0AAJ1U953_9RHOB|nr:TonB-dependent receptor [Rhodoalgimonas zhirmunskyi]MDQ2095611.1 TonB-dependent receptor [Rhodoalgimonas zhirmunskyi]